MLRSSGASALQIRQELWRRRCQKDLPAWCIEAQRFEGFTPARHHAFLLGILEQVLSGSRKRVIINMPPGSAKTRYTSMLLPPMAFMRHPRWHIIGASHTQHYADFVSGQVQKFIRENPDVLEFGLRTESVGEWWTTRDGFYFATGIGGALPGRRADLAIIDDPMKGREDADSDGAREKVWRWFWGDLRHRLKPSGRIIVMATRWHMDDLVGRLLKFQPGVWDLINLPAIAEEGDLMGRAVGELLWNDPGDPYGWGAELLTKKAELEAVGSSREWTSQYQGSPMPAEGVLFKVAKMPILSELPPGAKVVRAWDLAATAQVGTSDPDWTAGVKLGRLPDGRFVVIDVVRFRGGPLDVAEAIFNTARQDGTAVQIGLPQDPGQAGKQQITFLTTQLAGYRVMSSPETGSKETRAMPVAAQVEAGLIAMLDRPQWTGPFRDELASFPAGAKDDQVDALSRAFSMLVEAKAFRVTDGVLNRFGAAHR
ncbi:MAG TPA: phage terminase large subunit [Stellaceae bacterium]|nr:phage terminase large subunit [Stellaceae bacterium]